MVPFSDWLVSVHQMAPWWPERVKAAGESAHHSPRKQLCLGSPSSEYNYCSNHSGPVCFIAVCLQESHCSRDNIPAPESMAWKLVFEGLGVQGGGKELIWKFAPPSSCFWGRVASYLIPSWSTTFYLEITCPRDLLVSRWWLPCSWI